MSRHGELRPDDSPRPDARRGVRAGLGEAPRAPERPRDEEARSDQADAHGPALGVRQHGAFDRQTAPTVLRPSGSKEGGGVAGADQHRARLCQPQGPGAATGCDFSCEPAPGHGAGAERAAIGRRCRQPRGRTAQHPCRAADLARNARIRHPAGHGPGHQHFTPNPQKEPPLGR